MFFEVLKVLVTQSCPTLFDPMHCSPPGSCQGISRVRILEGLPFPPADGLPDPGIKPRSPTLQADSFFFLIFIFTLFYFTILYRFCHTLTSQRSYRGM